jgi:ribonuclease HI
MPDFSLLLSAAFKSELRASRHLSERTGRSPEEALRATLTAAAGAGTLTGLVDRRIAAKRADEDRANARKTQQAATLARRQARHDGKPTPWRAWFDGSAHPNPGDCGIGALLQGPAGQRVEISQPAGYGNSSEAEYRALIALLESAVRNGAHGLTIYGDSKVVIDDVNGSEYAAAMSLRELRTTALSLIAQLRDVSLRWIPRHKNTEADALSQLARNGVQPLAAADGPT